MADTKISALAAASALDLTETFPVVQSSTTKKATVTQMRAAIKSPYAVAEFVADVPSSSVDGTEDNLFATTLAAGLLGTNKDKVAFQAGGVNVGHATATRKLKVYFGGTAVFDSTAYAFLAANAWDIECLIVRVSASVVRATTRFTPSSYAVPAVGSATGAGCTEVTGLTLANTQVLKLTGAAAAVGAAAADITAKAGAVIYTPAA